MIKNFIRSLKISQTDFTCAKTSQKCSKMSRKDKYNLKFILEINNISKKYLKILKLAEISQKYLKKKNSKMTQIDSVLPQNFS